MFYEWLQRLISEAVQVGHPQHMSQLGIVNPVHVTDDVRNLARQIMQGSSPEEDAAAWERDNPPATDGPGLMVNPDDPDGPLIPKPAPVRHRPYNLPKVRNPDPSLIPILADALQDAGVTDEPFLACLRDPSCTDRDRELIMRNRRGVIRTLAQLDSWDSFEATQTRWNNHIKEYREQQLYEKAHKAVVGKNSILPVGYIKKTEHDLRGIPPPGVIWYRKAYSFNTGRFRKHVPYSEKPGRRLTRKELQQIAKERREAKRKKPEPPPSAPPSGL